MQCRRPGFNPWVGKIHWRRKQQPTLVFLPEESQGQRTLVGYSPYDLKELHMTEATQQTRMHMRVKSTFSLEENRTESLQHIMHRFQYIFYNI